MENKGKIFIPFIDGILNFDCQECGSVCCQMRGLIIMNPNEKKMLLQKYPYLRYFFVEETKKTYTLERYPRCWFLESSGLCHIQTKYGYSSKPFVCRLQPFYIARCADEYVVVIKECLCLYVDRGNKNKSVSYKRIFTNAQEAIDYDHLSEEIDWPKRRLNLEKKILECSKMFLDSSSYLDFTAYQISITTENKNIAEIKSELLESVELWKSFLEIDELSMENKGLTYELTAITSVLRTESFGLKWMGEDKVPLALLALYFYMILFSKNRKSKTYVETYKKVLSYICVGLLYLTNDDLNIKNRSIEGKISYLRLLQRVHTRKLIAKAKEQKGNAD